MKQKFLIDAMKNLSEDIELAQYSGSVSAYLSHKCGVSINHFKEQMRKTKSKTFTNLQESFKARYVLCFSLRT